MDKMRKRDYTLGMKVVTLILFIYATSLILPLLWGFVTSFKSFIDYMENPLSLPSPWMFSNYKTAYNYFFITISHTGSSQYVYIERMFLNSMIYSVGSAFVSTLVTCLVAYVTARFDYKLSKVVYWIVVVTMILPIVGSMASEKMIVNSLGLYDSFLGVFILKANFLGVYYLVFYASFKEIPREYEEAASIDGANNFQILFKIMLPVVKNVFATILLIKFIGFWNDYQTPLVYLPSKPTLSVGLFSYSSSAINEIASTPMKLAGALMIFLPIFVLYIIFQKYLIRGVSFGGIKE
ncbi:MAG: carbohydrate ABC transporter permease [Bacilli bacterium]